LGSSAFSPPPVLALSRGDRYKNIITYLELLDNPADENVLDELNVESIAV
jgi:hypothetical protein